MEIQTYQTALFDNGLRLVHLPVDSPVAYCGIAVNVGARDEALDEFGLAHFVEHMLFKGTTKRRAWHILNRMENVGGELNAYTTKEETFVYTVFMVEHFARALELMADLVINSCFPEREIEKEVAVILDEINSYEDSPSELIFDAFDHLLFGEHALGHPILGDEKSLRHFNSSKGRSFLERYYAPANMVVFSMGRMDFERLKRQVRKSLGEVDRSIAERTRLIPEQFFISRKTVHRDTHQAHVLIGGKGYSLHDDRRVPLFLLNNILGGPGMNSRLNVSLRERHGLVYTVESNVTSYTDTGMATIYFGTDPKNREKAEQLVYKELDKLRNQRLSTVQLEAAKKQLMGQLGVASDNRESLFLGLGKSYLHYDRYETLPEVFAQIDRLTVNDLLSVANEVFDPSALSCLIYE